METLEIKPRLNENFGWEPVDDGCMVYSLDSTQILTLNATAELLLSYCDGETSLARIYSAVNEEAPLSEADFMAAVNRLLSEKVLLPGDPL